MNNIQRQSFFLICKYSKNYTWMSLMEHMWYILCLLKVVWDILSCFIPPIHLAVLKLTARVQIKIVYNQLGKHVFLLKMSKH